MSAKVIAIDVAVRAELKRAAAGKRAPRCLHLIDWPTREQIYCGIYACPYCTLIEYQRSFTKLLTDLSRDNKAVVDQLVKDRGEAMAAANRLNIRNTQLQRFAIGLCVTPEQATELQKINAEQAGP